MELFTPQPLGTLSNVFDSWIPKGRDMPDIEGLTKDQLLVNEKLARIDCYNDLYPFMYHLINLKIMYILKRGQKGRTHNICISSIVRYAIDTMNLVEGVDDMDTVFVPRWLLADQEMEGEFVLSIANKYSEFGYLVINGVVQISL